MKYELDVVSPSELDVELGALRQEYLKRIESLLPPPLIHNRIAVVDYRNARNANEIARFPLAVINWTGSRDYLTEIRNLNPETKLFRYVNCTEWKEATTSNDMAHELRLEIDANNWWLRTAAGQKTQQMGQSGRYDVHPGYGWIERKFEWDKTVVEGYDGTFIDNVNGGTRKAADWKRIGVDLPANSEEANNIFCKGQGRYTDLHLSLGKPLIGNFEYKSTRSAFNRPEYKNKYRYAVLESMIGMSYSPSDPVERMLIAQSYGIIPIFCVRVDTEQEQRYGLCLGLMGDGYISLSYKAGYTAGVIWSEDFNIRLGLPVRAPTLANGVWEREYQLGTVIADMNTKTGTIKLK